MGCCQSASETEILVESRVAEPIEEPAFPQQQSRGFKFDPSAFVKHIHSDLSEMYELQGSLSSSSKSCIREAIHKETGVYRAIKSIRKSDVLDKSQLYEEVACLKALNHQHILRIFEVIEDSTHMHLVTELCRGGELYTKIVNKKRFRESTAALYMQQILSALAACHEANIAHGDLKPENILFMDDEDTSLKIIDFSNSTRTLPRQSTNGFVGSTYYVAPEVIEGSFNIKCDVWSAGVILYILLSGDPPFNGPDEDTILNKIRRGIYVFNGDVWETVSKEAKEFIRKMLLKSPEKRPTAQELLSDPWICKRIEEDARIDLVALKSFVRFKAKYMLQQATLAYVASHLLQEEDLAYLNMIFKKIDKDKNGRLSYDELKQALLDIGNEIDLNGIINECDTNENGAVDYNEFITAAANWKQMLTRKQLRAAFNAYDIDRDGTIDVKEIRDFFRGSEHENTDIVWNQIIEEIDQNKDGVIDFEEFEQMMSEYLSNNH